jgi:hypothetical protein
MSQTAPTNREPAKASSAHTRAVGAAETRRPIAEQLHEESDSRRSDPFAPLRWLRRKLSDLVRWAAKALRASLRPLIQLPMPEWLAERLPAPVRWLAWLFAPGRERGFGFWWLVATIAVAVALGLVVALLLIPVAALIALLVVAVWALVRRRRRRQDDSANHAAPASAPGAKQGFDAPGPAVAA